MNMQIKMLGKLSAVVIGMVVLSSCSSMGNMNTMPKVQTHHAHVVKHTVKKPVTHHKHHVKQASVTTQAATTKKVEQPVQPSVVMQPLVPGYATKPIQLTTEVAVTKPKAAITSANPVVGDMYLLNVHSIEFDPRRYQKVKDLDVIKNVKRLDAIGGNYHYIQAARWDNGHIDQTYINAKTAQLMSLIGLGLLEAGYIDSNSGFTMMVFSGNGHIMDVPGSGVDMIVIRAKNAANKTGKEVKPSTQIPNKNKSGSVKRFIKAKVAEFDSNDFYISGTDVITITSGHAIQNEKKLARRHTVETQNIAGSQRVEAMYIARSHTEPHTRQSWSGVHDNVKKYCNVETDANLNIPGTIQID